MTTGQLMKKYLYILIAAALWFHFYHIGESTPIGAGVTSPAAPFQGETAMQPMLIDSFEIFPRKSFEAEARVLAAERYYFERKALLSTTDLVIGWGDLSDESIYQKINFEQSDRSYQWQSQTAEIEDYEIRRSTANISIIPANDTIADQVANIKIGQVILLEGTLVDVERTMHWKWKTSLSRQDKGASASEILYLEHLEIVNPEISNY